MIIGQTVFLYPFNKLVIGLFGYIKVVVGYPLERDVKDIISLAEIFLCNFLCFFLVKIVARCLVALNEFLSLLGTLLNEFIGEDKSAAERKEPEKEAVKT